MAGITFWLFVAMLGMTSPWLILLYATSVLAFAILGTCLVIYLVLMIPWTHPQSPDSAKIQP